MCRESHPLAVAPNPWLAKFLSISNSFSTQGQIPSLYIQALAISLKPAFGQPLDVHITGVAGAREIGSRDEGHLGRGF